MQTQAKALAQRPHVSDCYPRQAPGKWHNCTALFSCCSKCKESFRSCLVL